MIVAAVPSRREMAERLAEATNATIVWDRGLGQLDTMTRAWESRQGADYTLVIEDDAVPHPDFLWHLAQVPQNAPAVAPISLYLGRDRRLVHRRISEAVKSASCNRVSWLRCNRLLHGVAVTLPESLIDPMLQGVSGTNAYDDRMSAYFQKNKIHTYYTVGSLVDHDDGPSASGHDRGFVRQAHLFEPPLTWNRSVIDVR